MELIIYPPPVTRCPTIPRWAPSHPLFQQLLSEATEAILDSAVGPFEALEEVGRAAFAILPKARRSTTPPGSTTFACEAHWLTKARAACGSGNAQRLRSALLRIPSYRPLFLADGGIEKEYVDDAEIAARVRSLRR